MDTIYDFDAEFEQSSEAPLTYTTNLPKDVEVKLYVGDIYPDNLNVKLYTYDEIGRYTLLTAGLTVIDGYITFNTSQLGTFVIVEAPEDLGLKEILIGAGIVLGAGLLVCIFIGLIKTRRKKRLISSSPINTPH